MAKDKIHRADLRMYQDATPTKDPEEPSSGFDDITAECHACGEVHVGVGTAVVMAVPGMIFPSMEYDVPVFIPDPDVQIRLLTLPNGMIGLVTDHTKTKYLHEECYTNLIDEVAYAAMEAETEDDEEEEDET